MNTTTRAKSTDPRQIPFTPSAGFVQAIAFRVRCVKCGEARPGGIQCCPCCGHTRNGLAGAPYPRGRLDRYRWAFDQEIADAIAEGRRPAGMSEDEEIVYDFSIELHRNRRVSDVTFQRALERFGNKGVIDLTGISGYYTFLAMQMNMARFPVPEGAARLPRFPD